MNEHTIYIVQKGEKVGGLGFAWPPCEREKRAAKSIYVFVRGTFRVYCIVVTGLVTEETARRFAINYYEGNVEKVDMNDAARIDRQAALWCEQFS